MEVRPISVGYIAKIECFPGSIVLFGHQRKPRAVKKYLKSDSVHDAAV